MNIIHVAVRIFVAGVRTPLISLTGNNDKCPLCNSDQAGKTDEEINKEIRKRVEAKDPLVRCRVLAGC
jgi:hypothetical protein